MIDYIFIDIDGTLLDHHGCVPESAKKAIMEAKNNGHRVFINTGRAKSGIPESVSSLPFTGFIYSAGTVIEIDDEQIHFDMLDKADVDRVLQLTSEKKLGCSLEGYHRSFYNEKARIMFQHLGLNQPEKEASESLEESMEGRLRSVTHYRPIHDKIHKFALFAWNREAFQGLSQGLPSHLKLIVHENAIKGLYLAEILKKCTSKATGIEKVLAHFDASREQTICYGDSLNDYEMLAYCKVGVCMEDGADGLKVVADDLALPSGMNGIYESFKKYGLINASECD